MAAPLASDLARPPCDRSRHSGRPVATGADGLPLWTRAQAPRRASPTLPPSDAESPHISVVEAGADNGGGR